MNIRLLLFINLILISFAQAKTVYKTVDAEGNVVFSDAKTTGAEEIRIEEAQTIKSPPLDDYEYTPKDKKKTQSNYTKLNIVSPENDTTIHSNPGNINVSIELEPALQDKDEILLFVDGKQLLSGRNLEFSLSNIDRGTHTIGAAVINEKKKVLIRSEKVVLHLRRMSRLFPNFPGDTPPAQ